MAAGSLRKWWGKLSFKNPLLGLDKRRLQHEIDIHRLFLLTSYHRLGAPASNLEIEEIQRQSMSLSFDQQLHAVQQNVHVQVMGIARTICDAIAASGTRSGMRGTNSADLSAEQSSRTDLRHRHRDPTSGTSGRKRPSGLGLAVGGSPLVAETEYKRRQHDKDAVSMDEVGAVLREKNGFTLLTSESGIEHPDAGLGLTIKGSAGPGSVVAMYPGIVYSPLQYSLIPGYPDIADDNAYLIARFDGTIIDAKPWGKGGQGRQRWGMVAGGESSWQEPAALLGDASHDNKTFAKQRPTSTSPSPSPSTSLSPSVVVDRRHPLALAHYANHPPKGVQPNVAIFAYDFSVQKEEERDLREWVPNVNCQELGTVDGLKTIVLISLREIDDEELLRNYRLNPKLQRPLWYFPVDAEEEERRWA